MDLRRSLARLPLTVEPPLRSVVVAQGSAQSGLGNLQGRRPQSLSGQPVPLLGCLHGENIASRIQPDRLLPRRVPVVPLPPSRHSCEEPGSGSSMASLGGCSPVPPKLSQLQAGAATDPQPLPSGQAVQLWLSRGPSAELARVYQLRWGPETGRSIVGVIE